MDYWSLYQSESAVSNGSACESNNSGKYFYHNRNSFYRDLDDTENCTHWSKWTECEFPWFPCNISHAERRYSDASVSWVLTAAIIVFFMKAGFMLLEIAFAMTPRDRRIVVIYKYMDAFASALGFFLIGFDGISGYTSPQCISFQFFDISDPVLWFFKFTFASNAATILGGCLVSNKYKLRLPAAFISAFVISGIIHPIVALFIWSNSCSTFSPYRFCGQKCLDCSTFIGKAYFLDFAGGGAVHLLGGTAGLMVCLFAKLQDWRDKKATEAETIDQIEYESIDGSTDEPAEQEPEPKGFWDWMYPPMAGNENVEMAALGVLILWFAWFAFNCGSTESVESGRYGLYHVVPSRIAINMILCCAAGGIVAIAIASWAQLRYRTDSINANEIANGILSCLVAITASCPFVSYPSACAIGIIAVIVYHLGCYAEYKLGIEDTARVVPVHGVCGLWSLLAVALFVGTFDKQSLCHVHATFEGLCFCDLRLPQLNWGERLGAQVIGSLVILSLGLSTGIVYGILYIIPIQPFITVIAKLTRLNHDLRGRKLKKLKFYGGFLLTSPKEDFLTGQENIGDMILPPNTAATNVNYSRNEYVSVNQSDSSMGYVSGEELRNFPQPRSSESSQSDASSQQPTVSVSQPLLGHSRTRPKYRSVNVRHNNDSTI